MAMVSDQIDISARTTTTLRATQFIVDHIPRRLKLVFIPSMYFSFFERSVASGQCLLADHVSLLSLRPEIHRERKDDRNRLAVERPGLELPSFDGIDSRLIQSEGKAF